MYSVHKKFLCCVLDLVHFQLDLDLCLYCRQNRIWILVLILTIENYLRVTERTIPTYLELEHGWSSSPFYPVWCHWLTALLNGDNEYIGLLARILKKIFLSSSLVQWVLMIHGSAMARVVLTVLSYILCCGTGFGYDLSDIHRSLTLHTVNWSVIRIYFK